MTSPPQVPERGDLPSARRAITQFTLYSRSFCHLCDDMLAALEALAGAQPFAVDVIDIDADPALLERFDELVPVLFGADLAAPELCHYFLDHEAVLVYLSARGSDGSARTGFSCMGSDGDAESPVELTPANRGTG